MTRDNVRSMSVDNVSNEQLPFGIKPTPLEAIAPAYLERYRTSGRFHRDAETPK